MMHKRIPTGVASFQLRSFIAVVLLLCALIVSGQTTSLAQTAAGTESANTSVAAASPDSTATPPPAVDFVRSTVWYVLLIFFVYFFLVLRPQFLKEDNQKKFIEGLKKNDEVVTSSGIFGRVSYVRPEIVTVEIASGVKIKLEAKHVLPVTKSLQALENAPDEKKA